MKTVLDKQTGKVLYCFFEECEILENEIIIQAIPTGNYYNFETQEFYSVIEEVIEEDIINEE
jgi:hypothetical protein